jgi:hypothetical protein
MRELLQGLGGVQADVAWPDGGARPLCIPRTRVLVEPGSGRPGIAALVAALRAGEPAVAVGADARAHTLWLNPQHLADGEEDVVAARVRAVLTAA